MSKVPDKLVDTATEQVPSILNNNLRQNAIRYFKLEENIFTIINHNTFYHKQQNNTDTTNTKQNTMETNKQTHTINNKKQKTQTKTKQQSRIH